MNTSTTDGRRLRTEQSRQRIIDAMIELTYEGMLEPTAEQVSERAGVAMRTVFRHFNDMESLYSELSRLTLERVQPLLEAEIGGATWEETLHNLIERRARLYEEIAPLRRAGGLKRHRSEFLERNQRYWARIGRRTLATVLPGHLAAEPWRLEALDLLLSFESWDRLRREQKLSARRARDVLHSAANELTQ
ncbi:MAG: hypothetical protein R3E86_03745 [Pseudomonadales bacterium]